MLNVLVGPPTTLRSGRVNALPVTSRSALRLVVLDGHDEEDQQRETLDGRQQEEVVVQLAVVDITLEREREREGKVGSQLRVVTVACRA